MKYNILVTGTSSGFGKLTAITLANAGHQVIATMRNTTAKNKTVAEELAAHADIEVVDMDLESDASVKETFTAVLEKYGHIDVLVNNAGLSIGGFFEAHSMDQVKMLFETNVYGVFRTYKAVLPEMRARKAGLIINISSGLGLFSLPGITPYAATKFAVEALTEGIREEVRPFGIENVSIQCGAYPTGIMTKGAVQQMDEEITAIYREVFPSDSAEKMKLLLSIMEEFKMDPQNIADAVLALVDMEVGSRPEQFPLDAVAQGADKKFITVRDQLKKEWLSNHR